MMKRFIMLVLAAGLFVCVGNAQAQCTKGKNASCCASKTKAKLTEAKAVTKDEVASMIQGGSVTVVDARDENSYNAGHIAGAISLVKEQLPADKSTKLVFYCGGVFCSAAPKAAKKAISQGYTNVMVFHGGWADWSKDQI